jgi:hypothetical protein
VAWAIGFFVILVGFSHLAYSQDPDLISCLRAAREAAEPAVTFVMPLNDRQYFVAVGNAAFVTLSPKELLKVRNMACLRSRRSLVEFINGCRVESKETLFNSVVTVDKDPNGRFQSQTDAQWSERLRVSSEGMLQNVKELGFWQQGSEIWCAIGVDVTAFARK